MEGRREGGREGEREGGLTVILPLLTHGRNKAIVQAGGGVGVIEDRLVLTEPALVLLVRGGGRGSAVLGPDDADGVHLGREGDREGGREREVVRTRKSGGSLQQTDRN